MKTFLVSIQRFHESYSGYTHNDGAENYKIRASNKESARNKAIKKAQNQGGGYDYRVMSCDLIN